MLAGRSAYGPDGFAAGGLADLKFLSGKKDTTSASEFASKVVGTRNPLGVIQRIKFTQSQSSELLFLFSSLASILGGPAIAAHTAANRFTDAFARRVQSKLDIRWIKFQLGRLDYSYDEQVTAAYQTCQPKDFTLSSAEGIDIIKCTLTAVDNGQIVVRTRPLSPRMCQTCRRTIQKYICSKLAKKDKETTMTGIDPRKKFLEGIKSLLGTTQNISFDDNFFDLGGDSLLAAELQLRLEESDHWRSPQLEDIFNAATFGDLYERICKRSSNHQSQ
ncbi:KR domain-containing protein [Mesorhizobium sp. M0118]|uniref:KR domain-containing protein n=1 Tax=Mesorhizobium sp. M0118 TaxID=2956884 RepID=UPI0033390B6F